MFTNWESMGRVTRKVGSTRCRKSLFSGLLSSGHFYYAAVLHFFTTPIIIYKTELHIDNSYNCIAYMLKERYWYFTLFRLHSHLCVHGRTWENKYQILKFKCSLILALIWWIVSVLCNYKSLFFSYFRLKSRLWILL